MWFCFIWSQFSKKWKHNANFKKASVIAVPLVYHVLIKQVWYIHGFLHDDSSLPLVCGNCFLNRHKVAFWNWSSIFGVQNFESLSTCFTFDCVVDTWERPCMTFNHVSYFYIYIYIYIFLFFIIRKIQKKTFCEMILHTLSKCAVRCLLVVSPVDKFAKFASPVLNYASPTNKWISFLPRS